MFRKLLLYNFGSQLFARVISFIINLNFYRIIDGDLLGLINVQLTLMYNTALFLSREPVRRTVLANNGKFKELIATMWISFGLSIIFGIILSVVWMVTLMNVSSNYQDKYFFMIFMFFLSIIVEGFSEPFAMSCMKLGESERFLIAQGVLVFLQKVSSAFLIFIFKFDHVNGLCYGQLIGSIDTSGYVMTFTKSLSLKEQATYDAIEKIGSLAVRIILKPLEEAAQIFYNSKSTDGIGIVGLVIAIFSSPYSGIAVRILLGENLLKYANGALLLSAYAKVLVIMAINGLTECLAMSLMNEIQISKHGIFLFGLGISNIAVSIILSKNIGSIGFIISNGIHMVIRILYNCIFIDKIKYTKFRPFSDYYLKKRTLFILFLSIIFTQLSYYIFEVNNMDKNLNILGIVNFSFYDLIHIAIGFLILIVLSLSILKLEYSNFKISSSLLHRKLN
ncbi:Protein RFT1 homolog [Strongyloides ratti]|uniref:Protein RFT1 homolog n=1 Tax=Strongyloides ratti TaxID=34506 RepID=A0A090L446_STRRB|nr:Protein RFT1 homolog [Strongyloides ratti]CEF64497.1 Protein RFT1 homolog [Strongyloides ratti]